MGLSRRERASEATPSFDGFAGVPCLLVLPPLSLRLPFSSRSSTGTRCHILIRCSTCGSRIRPSHALS